MKLLFAVLLMPCSCLSSDRSDRLPSPSHDNVTNNITITNNQPSPSPSPRVVKVLHAGPRHPKVEAAHEDLRRRQEDDDLMTCCCFFKIKKLPFS